MWPGAAPKSPAGRRRRPAKRTSRASKSALDKKLAAALGELKKIRQERDAEDVGGTGSSSRPGSSLGRPPPSPADGMTAGRKGARSGPAGTSAARNRTKSSRSGSSVGSGGGAGKKNAQELAKRLSTAETVMRKLYQRNLRLESELATAKEAAAKGGSDGKEAEGESKETAYHKPAIQRPPTRAGSGADSPSASEDDGGSFGLELDSELDLDPNPDEGSLDALLLVHVQQEKHLRRMIEERDVHIRDLNQAVNDLRRATTPASSAAAESAARNVSAATSAGTAQEIESLQTRLQEALDDSARYQSAYIKARTDYRRLVSARVKEATDKPKYGSTSKAKPVTTAARKLIEALSERLTTTDEERLAETAAFNKKLLSAEQQHCDWFVEKKLMEERISSLLAQIAERDQIEDKMELCVHSLFERIKQLEITNHNLRRRAGVVSRGGTPSSEAMRTPTRRDSTPTFDHAGTGGKSSED